MNKKSDKRGIAIHAIIPFLVTMTIGLTLPKDSFAPGQGGCDACSFDIAPVAIKGDNVYVAWRTNDTENNNDEVMFRASFDAGQTFGAKINLSNTTDKDSSRIVIDADADTVVITWWESNQTSDIPVLRVSNDKGATFGPLLTLSTNETIGAIGHEIVG